LIGANVRDLGVFGMEPPNRHAVLNVVHIESNGESIDLQAVDQSRARNVAP